MRESEEVPKKEMKVRVSPKSRIARFFLGPVGRGIAIAVAAVIILGLGAFTYFYAKYSSMVADKLHEPFANTARIFSSPEAVYVGDAFSPEDIAARLRRSGYSEARSNRTGYYISHPDSLEVFPGPDSYFVQEAGELKFAAGKISQIISLQDNTARGAYQLEPQLITNVSGPSREKRRVVKFRDIPQIMVNALTSVEDKHFFQHSGFDPVRIVKAAYTDIREGRKDQGASTLSMQLAKMILGDYEKRWSYKFAEVMVTLQIEQKLSKQEIFQYYANDVPLGARGSFQIHGFGEASEVYFGKDLSQISLPEAAALAGMVQRPSVFDPYRHPDRLKTRRNIVLGLMRDNGYISDRDCELAIASPVVVAKVSVQSTEAPYFVDLVDDTLQTKFQDADFQSNAYRIYTTLDMRLQRAAADAVRDGMQLVDEQIKKQRRFKGQTPPEAQVALIALDPHTGEVKALSGGRNYGASQLNHVKAMRQPGSIFKPFVYAAALNTALVGAPKVITTSTIVNADPTTFYYDGGKEYSPRNFDKNEGGDMTIREALAHSVNVAAVHVAEMVGYDKVVEMARRAGLNDKIEATPAVALGSYEITPLEAAGAYTMFANSGTLVKPSFISMVRSQDGAVVYKSKAETKKALDPRVTYLMTSLMEEVLRSGTAAGVRGKYGFTVPAAGKTGTSFDGWFAGYTSELLCIVWVGFDDNRELKLEGAHSAAPIWAEFMKKALSYHEYRDAKPFKAPEGVVGEMIDPINGLLATGQCPGQHYEVYIAGTEPVQMCPIHGGRIITTNAGWDTNPQPVPPPRGAVVPSSVSAPLVPNTTPDAVARRAARQIPPDPEPVAAPAPQQPAPQPPKPKKGLLRRIFGRHDHNGE